jgi:type IV pilus assembly protein PilB
VIEPDDLKRAQAEAKRRGISIASAILELELVSEADLTAFLAGQYGKPAVDLSRRSVAADVTKLIAKEVALRLRAMPVERIGSVLIVAMADPSNVYATDELERLTKLDLEVVVASEPGIIAAIDRHYPA